MPRPDSIFQKNTVVVYRGRPAILIKVPEYGRIEFNYIGSDGYPDGYGWVDGYNANEELKVIDLAEVRTHVTLPPEWQKVAFDYEATAKEKTTTIHDMEWEPETHPSYGVIEVSRPSGDQRLFMSPFRHMHYMALRIARAQLQRGLANDSTFAGRGEIIEVLLSETQWARMVASAGMGGGTPCTISSIGYTLMPACPERSETEKFNEDVRRSGIKMAQYLDETIKFVEGIMAKPSVTKKDRAEITNKLTQMRRQVADSMPFIVNQFSERMETIVEEGKSEIDTFFQNTIRRLGIEKLLGANSESPVVLELGKGKKDE